MKRRKLWIGWLAALGLLAAGCNNGVASTPTTAVTLTPTSATVSVGATQTFTAAVSTTSTNMAVTWEVNSIVGGNSTVGTIDVNGNYTAPSTVPNPNVVTVTAISQVLATAAASASVTIDSGVRVSLIPATATIGTGETLPIAATVTGTTNLNVTWSVCQVAAISSSTTTTSPCPADTTGTLGSVDVNGNYTAPTTLPSNNPVTIQAASVADPNQFALSTVTLQSVVDPTVTSVYPTVVGQGAPFADVYLQGTNFLTTTVVLVNGAKVAGTNTGVGNSMRVRVSPFVMSASPTVLQIQVERQHGSAVGCTPTPTLCQIAVEAERPAIVSASPNSGLQGSTAPLQFNIDGGYFGTNEIATTPSVAAAFDGSIVGGTISPRQFNVTLNPAALTTPGLHQVTVTNPLVTLPAISPQQIAAINFSVQPSSGATIELAHLAVGTNPVAIAMNTATGIAVVANYGSNNLTLVDLTGSSPAIVPGGPIPVGNGPTGVAVDNVRDLAVVANNTDQTISIVNLATRNVTTLSTQIPAAPYSVGVNPITGIALIAYQTTNIGALVDLTQTPPAFVGTVTLGTGLKPQVAVMPGLNWGLVTPGGAGTFSIVDLGRGNSNTIAAGGAVRATPSGTATTVTITTTTPNTLVIGDAVLIAGVTDPSFNGIYTVSSVPTSTSFTYLQSGPNTASGGGTATYSEPLAVVGFGENVAGIAVNPEAKQAIMTDATSQSPALIMSVLDQAVTSVSQPASSLGAGNAFVAVNPYTDIAVTINPATDMAAIIDPRSPQELSTFSLPGSNPGPAVFDPGTNQLVVVNSGGNDLSVFSMGAINSPQLESVVLPINRQLGTDLTLSSATNLPLTLIGKGFQPGAVARVDGFVLPAVGTVTDRQMSVVVPASLLGSARRFAVDVANPTGPPSNVEGLSVVQPVNLVSTACPSPIPSAVAIDDIRNTALVAQSGCNSLAFVNLATGTVTQTVPVGVNPQGVAVAPGFGTAVVTNRGDNTVTIVDVADTTQSSSTFAVGVEPTGVAISPLDGTTLVTNSNANSDSVSNFTANIGTTSASGPITAGAEPVAVAIDPVDLLAAVTNAASGSVSIFNIANGAVSAAGSVSGPNQPTGVVFDPADGLFIVTASLANSLFLVNPTTLQFTAFRAGINPTAIAYNPNTSTIVTVNELSSTVSVMDVQSGHVQANMGIKGALLGSVAIHPLTNIAVISDTTNNRLLLVPLPY